MNSKMKKYKILALCGESGAGKDRTLQEIIRQDKLRVNPYFHEVISHTTRPPREGEVDGINYYYITPEEFADKVLNGDMLEATEHRNWFYGTSIASLDIDKINIGVFNPAGIEILSADKRVEVTTIKLEVCAKTRLIRQLTRVSDPDVDEIIRRYQKDRLDFCTADFEYLTLPNETEQDLQDNIERLFACARLLGELD